MCFQLKIKVRSLVKTPLQYFIYSWTTKPRLRRSFYHHGKLHSHFAEGGDDLAIWKWLRIY
jgi:hypothetical protein